MDEPRALTREQLYDQVWTDPVYKVAARHGLSGSGLAKLCKRHRIPTPDRGYWTKKEFGKRVRRKRLPKAPAALDEVVIARAGQAAAAQPAEPPVAFPERVRITHPLVRASKNLLRDQTTHVRDGVLQPPDGCMDIHVSRKQLRRALRIMQVLVTALEARGWEVEVAKSRTRVNVDGEWVCFGIEERRRQVSVPSEWNPDYYDRRAPPQWGAEAADP